MMKVIAFIYSVDSRHPVGKYLWHIAMEMKYLNTRSRARPKDFLMSMIGLAKMEMTRIILIKAKLMWLWLKPLLTISPVRPSP